MRHRRRLAPVLSDRQVVARHPVAWLRLIVACIAGSLLLTALNVWGLRGYVDERGHVRDRQYRHTQEQLDVLRDRVDDLDAEHRDQERRLEELERRLRVTPSRSGSASPGRPDSSSGTGRPSAGAAPTAHARTRGSSTSTARSPAPTPSHPAPSPDPAEDKPWLCLPLVGCLL